MPAPDIRLRTTERYRRMLARAEQKASGAAPGFWTTLRTATGALALRGGFAVRRGLTAPLRAWNRVRTSAPPLAPQPPRADGGRALPFLIVGHRGSPKKLVENTIPSCERALEDGANALEIDLSMTEDGHVVLWHDWDPNDTVALARQLGLEPTVKFLPRTPMPWSEWRRKAHELTLEELRAHHGYQATRFLFWRRAVAARIPTLREFFEWARDRSALRAVFLDVKIPGDLEELAGDFVDAVRALIDEFQPAYECVYMTPHKNVLRAMKARESEREPAARGGDYSWDIEVAPGIVLDESRYSGVRAAIDQGNRFASVGRPALTFGAWRLYQEIIESDVALLAEEVEDPESPVESLISWTINARNEQRRLIRLGVHGILTDTPRRLERLLRKERRER